MIADNLFLWIMMSMIFAQVAEFAKHTWEKAIGFTAMFIFTGLAIAALFLGRK